MPPKKRSSKPAKASGFVIGTARFEKISAVEGIHYSRDMKVRSATAKRKDLTPEERRKIITDAYRKG